MKTLNKYTYRIVLAVPIDISVWAPDLETAMITMKTAAAEVIAAGAQVPIVLVAVEVGYVAPPIAMKN